ncbi:unnamed protein product, partial [Rotaria sp. Silwood2]
VRLITDPVYITINAVYFPMNPNGQQHETNAVEIFYDDLQRTVDKVPSNDLLLLMGDFNARAGKQQHKTSGNIVGLHAIDHINENGQRLIGFCSMNNLVISNTFFEHKPIHKMTWMHPGNKKWHMIDDTIVNKKFRSIGEDVRVHRINCKELANLKNNICFIDDDNDKNVIVKSGIKAGVDYLITIL